MLYQIMSTSHGLRPFYFSQLTSDAKREPTKTLDLISRLSSSLPPLKQPTIAISSEPMMEHMPDWVANLVVDKGATFAWKVMEKEIYVSDASDQQNRFMIRKHVVDDRIMPAMTEKEIAMANLISSANSNRRRLYGRDQGEDEAGDRKQGREHGGLDVMVYNRSGWGCLLYLTRWDASKASVLKGGKYREFHRRSFFTVGVMVEMWAFRDGDGKLCFAIGNNVDLDFSL